MVHTLHKGQATLSWWYSSLPCTGMSYDGLSIFQKFRPWSTPYGPLSLFFL